MKKIKLQKLEDKTAILYEKADRFSTMYGLEDRRTVKAWKAYDRAAAKLDK